MPLYNQSWNRLGLIFSLLLTVALSAAVPSICWAENLKLIRQGESGMGPISPAEIHENESHVMLVRNGEVVFEYDSQEGSEVDVIIEFEGTPVAAMKGVSMQEKLMIVNNRNRESQAFKRAILDIENATFRDKGKAAKLERDVFKREFHNVFHGIAARVQKGNLKNIEGIPGVKKIWPDEKVKAHLDQSVPLIGANRVWTSLGVTGKDILVAVLDTGIAYTHPDLGGCIGINCKIIGGKDFVNKDDDPLDDNGHGTHVAGIIAANGIVKGVAPNARLLAVKVLDSGGNGFSSTIIEGIEYAVDPDQNPATADGAKIINLSLGGSGSPDDPVSRAVDTASDLGVVVCVAAGNNGSGGYETIGSPGLARKALTVGSSNKYDFLSHFSSLGPSPEIYQIKPEVLAPGENIYSTYLSSGYTTLSGTSMATPHVAGAAALLLERSPWMMPEAVKQALMQRAKRLKDNLLQPYNIFQQGSGRIDIYASATLGVLGLPGNLGLGVDDTSQPTFDKSQTITLTNYNSAPVTYNFSATGTCSSGCIMNLIPASLTLAPGETRGFEFKLNVNNSLTPDLLNAPYDYEGNIEAVAAGDAFQMPFAFFKAPLVTLQFDADKPSTVYLFNRNGTYKTIGSPQNGQKVLVGQGIYDILAYFNGSKMVIQEGMEMTENRNLPLLASQATCRVGIIPSGIDGNILSVERVIITRSIYFKMSDFILASMGGPYEPWSDISPISSNVVIELSMLVNSYPSRGPSYTFHFGSKSGVSTSTWATNRPEDFRREIHKLNFPTNIPNVQPEEYFFIRLGSREARGGAFGSRCSLITPPFVMEAYYLPPPYPEFLSGYVHKNIYALSDPNNCKSNTVLQYSIPLMRPKDRRQLDFSWFRGYLFSSDSETVNSGLGPYFWSGIFDNYPTSIRWYSPYGMTHYFPFTSQVFDIVQPNGDRSIPFELYKGSDLIRRGSIEGEWTLSVPVSGRYRLKLLMNNYYISGNPGLATVDASFNTAAPDRNPPFITQFIVEKDGNISYPLVGGEQIWLGVGDDIGVASVTLEYKPAEGSWVRLPLSSSFAGVYSTFFPFDLYGVVGLRISAADMQGNTLQFETQVYVASNTNVFIDVPNNHWASAYILRIYGAGWTTGCVQDDPSTPQNERRYCPDNAVPREQVAAFLVRAISGEPPANYCEAGTPFSDVAANTWSCKYIKKLRELGLTTGYGDGRYGPSDLITREQVAAFLVRAVSGEPPANYCDSGALFSDVAADTWSCKYIKKLRELGLTTGYGDGRYGPGDSTTRSQMAAFLVRAFLGIP